MQKYKHILFATDLSKESKEIGKRAHMMADKLHANLSIVHIVEFYPIIYAGEYALPLDEEVRTTMNKQAKEALAKQAKQLNIPESQQYLEQGATAESLISLVEKIKADLLVLGNHHQSAMALLLGSTANTMFRHMPCDILAIHV